MNINSSAIGHSGAVAVRSEMLVSDAVPLGVAIGDGALVCDSGSGSAHRNAMLSGLLRANTHTRPRSARIPSLRSALSLSLCFQHRKTQCSESSCEAYAPRGLDAPKHRVEVLPAHTDALHCVHDQAGHQPDVLRRQRSSAHGVHHHGALAAGRQVDVAEGDAQRARLGERAVHQPLRRRPVGLRRRQARLGFRGIGRRRHPASTAWPAGCSPRCGAAGVAVAPARKR